MVKSIYKWTQITTGRQGTPKSRWEDILHDLINYESKQLGEYIIEQE
jgi:hypothetical protein